MEPILSISRAKINAVGVGWGGQPLLVHHRAVYFADMPWSQTAPLPGHLHPGAPMQFLPPGRPQATPLPLIQPGAPIVVPPGAFRPVQGAVLLQGPQLNGPPLSPQAALIGRPAGAIAAAPPSDPPKSLANGKGPFAEGP